MVRGIEAVRRFLSNIPIFGGLEESSLERVVGMLVEQHFARGSEVCREGENGRAMYIVAEGEVVVCLENPGGPRIRMVRMGPGEFFGEMTLIDPQPRSATVVVERDATLYALTNRDLYELYTNDIQGYVMLLQNLCRELARRLRRADERIFELAREDSVHITQIRPGFIPRRRHDH